MSKVNLSGSDKIWEEESQTVTDEQLLTDAKKCIDCGNHDCSCAAVAAYILRVGAETFKQQAQDGSFPSHIRAQVKRMNLDALVRPSTHPEYYNILKVAGTIVT